MSFDGWPQQSDDRVINVNAGPGPLPCSVQQQAQSEMQNFRGSGMSIMEMSHRSKVFMDVYYDSVKTLKNVLNLGEEYEVLFMQGGATFQFTCVPINLQGILGGDRSVKPSANYLVTGCWSEKAAEEATKFLQVNIIGSNKSSNYTHLPEVTMPPQKPLYTYVCTNETVHGVELSDEYIATLKQDSLLVADMSSNFCSKSIASGLYDLIFAGAQKNVGPAGVTIVLIKKELLAKCTVIKTCPISMNYQLIAKNESMYNTPPCYSMYVCGLVFKWIEQVTLKEQARVNTTKANMLYTCLEANSLFRCPVEENVRSNMNIVFVAMTYDIEQAFQKYAEEQNIVGIAGHRSVGGFRASLYNAVSLAQVARLVELINQFTLQYAN